MSGLKSPAPTLAELRKTLSGLQDALGPLSSRTFDSIVSQIEEGNREGKLQSAQLHASLAYVVLDLVWIFLKVSGVQPSSHPVTTDLQRVQEYLTKIHTSSKRDEGQDGQDEGDARTAAVDKAKVGRFLRHALGTAASGKRTIFADDGTVERVVDAGPSKEDGNDGAAGEEKKDQEKEGEESGWEQASSKRAKRQGEKAERALRKASKSIEASKKKHKKV